MFSVNPYRMRKIGVYGLLATILGLILAYSLLSAAGVAFSYLYYIPLVVVATIFSNRSIWTAAALSLGYAAVTLFLAIGGYIFDPVLVFLFTLLYLWGMAGVTLFTPPDAVSGGKRPDLAGLFGLDPGSLLITHADTQFCDLLGRRRDEVAGLPLSSIWLDEPGRTAFCGMLGRGVEVSNYEACLYGRDGKSVPVLLSGKPGMLEFQCSALDLGSLETFVQAQNSADEVKKRLSEEEMRRMDFFKTAAHELRTPLQPVLGYLYLLTEDRERYGISEETGRMLKVCLDNIQRERSIVNRMLELSLLDAGRVICTSAEIGLGDIVREVIAAHDLASSARITMDVGEDVCLRVNRDQFYLIMESLILNAVQYNDDPRLITVGYREDAACQYVSVTDNGIGIDPVKIGAIFEPFYLGDEEKLSRSYNRMGLGLPIAERYARLNNGKIQVESTPGMGSTFTVVLHRGRDDAA
ncbi:ATP-binding protein [Methanofollis fontis]|nr:ATP-binding protein [Methanofollis fontis]